MGFLLKIVIFAVAVYGIWATARRFYRLFGGSDGASRRPAPTPERRETAVPPPRAGGAVVEDTRLCAVCGSYVAAGAARCGRSDCPQAA
ncbi:MAG: hypothetical protein KIS73_26425 [Enhydrobacter sp.]|nr:hypothetical protein [Enhydrobacter sp.]